MSATPEQQNTLSNCYEDEINLKDLFHNIGRTKVAWVVAILVTSMLFWGLWGVKQLALPNVKTYSLVVDLTFENIEKGLYPNKTKFNRSDIIASSVLQKVYEINNIKAYEVSFSEFIQMFNISPYAEGLEAIEKKFELRLSDSKKLTPQDIDLIQSAKNKEILGARLRSVLLQFTELKANSIPLNVIEKSLRDVFKVWADKAINERNVLKSDIPLLNALTVQKDLVDELDYSIALDFVKKKISLLKQSFALILQLPNSKGAIDPVSGFSIEDMQQSINDRLEYQLTLIEAPITQLGISRYPSLTRVYYTEALYILKEKSRVLDLKAIAVQETLENYIGTQGNRNSEGKPVVAPSTVSPQFTGDFLDKIISLSGESSDTVYKQSLASQILEFRKEKADVVVRIRALERKIKALTKVAGEVVSDADKKLKVETIALLNDRIPKLLDVLSRHLESTQRIYALLDKNTISGDGNLYQLTGKGVKATGGYFSSIKSQLIAYIILMFLTTIVIVPWKMYKNAE